MWLSRGGEEKDGMTEGVGTIGHVMEAMDVEEETRKKYGPVWDVRAKRDKVREKQANGGRDINCFL